jgi:hypothetical protein
MINKLKLVNHKQYDSSYDMFCLHKVNLNCYLKQNYYGFLSPPISIRIFIINIKT